MVPPREHSVNMLISRPSPLFRKESSRKEGGESSRTAEGRKNFAKFFRPSAVLEDSPPSFTHRSIPRCTTACFIVSRHGISCYAVSIDVLRLSSSVKITAGFEEFGTTVAGAAHTSQHIVVAPSRIIRRSVFLTTPCSCFLCEYCNYLRSCRGAFASEDVHGADKAIGRFVNHFLLLGRRI